MVVLSDKTSRFHPRHVVLKPTKADEFELVWFSLLLVVGVVAGTCGRFWPKADVAG
jgi:hypothetical protein